MRDFRELQVWSKAHALTLDLYTQTRAFPRDEMYGLTAQIRRAAVSIGANIAEGCGRGSGRHFAKFLQIALGSASELQYHVLLAADLGLISRSAHQQLDLSTSEVKRMLTAFIHKLTADG